MYKIETRPITEQERALLQKQWNKWTPLPRMLPHRTVGNFLVTRFEFFCGGCGKELPLDRVRAEHRRFPSGVDEFRALGFCRCRTATRFRMRVAADGEPILFTGDGWIPTEVVPPTPHWWDLVGWWRWLLRKIR